MIYNVTLRNSTTERVRGLPETVDTDHLPQVISDIFNGILEKPLRSLIPMERIHRALRPRGRESDPPRDVICYINYFAVKEAILKKAREKIRLNFEDHQIQIYQDLSVITLKNRRDLRPLLEVLKTKGICYRWKFPFRLSPSHQGRLALLRVPKELNAFCKHLDMPFVAVPDWYAEFMIPEDHYSIPEEEPIEAQNSRMRRRCSPSLTRINTTEPNRLSPHSPSAEPLPRRTRQDQMSTPRCVFI